MSNRYYDSMYPPYSYKHTHHTIPKHVRRHGHKLNRRHIKSMMDAGEIQAEGKRIKGDVLNSWV